MPLSGRSQTFDVQTKHFDCLVRPLERKSSFSTSRLVCHDLAVAPNPYHGRKRWQRSGIDKIRIKGVAFGFAAATIPPYWIKLPLNVDFVLPRSAFATSDQISWFKLPLCPFWTVPRNYMFDLAIKFAKINLAISAESMLNAQKRFDQLSICRPGIVISKPRPIRAALLKFKVSDETKCGVG